MGRTAYLIAKYVEDVFRNEPKNIGVLLWAEGSVFCKFVGQRADRSIDGKQVRGVFRSLNSYKQWVIAWEKMLNKEAISHRGSPSVKRSSPEFLEVIRESGEGNYILESGGEILDEVTASNIGDVGHFLFSRLVADPTEEDDYKSAIEVRDAVLTEAKVISDPRMRLNQIIPVPLENGVTAHEEFHFSVGNGNINCLGQILSLMNKPKSVKTTAQSIAYRFSKASRAEMVSRNVTKLVLVHSQESDTDEIIKESMSELTNEGAQIINLIDARHEAIKTISDIVKATPMHEQT